MRRTECSLPQQRRDSAARIAILISAGVLLAVFLLSLLLGQYLIAPQQAARILAAQFIPLEQTWSAQMETILINVRLPRLIAAALVGAALSVSGATYQGLFCNPLVSPDLLGVSSGACVGAAAAILLHVRALTEVSAFFFALLTVFITTLIPKLFRNSSSLMLVLSGILIGGLMTSIMSFLKYVADADTELAEIVYWTMGSLASVRWRDLSVVVPVITATLLLLLLLRWRLNLISLGEKDASSLGVNVRRLRAVIITCSTVLTSCAVCISGTIGWVGLIVPHMGRLIVGQDNKNLLPVSMLLGGAFMVIVDTICRSITINEIPLSIFTGLIGVPLFIILMLAQKKRIE